MIPRTFHQIWLGPDALPEEFQEYRRTWQEHHPEWELRLWTEDDLPQDLQRREVYELERSAAERSDLLRLELILRHGGVYLDTDLECVQPIDALLEGVSFFTGLLKPTRVNNAVFGAVPNHPILVRAVETARAQKIGEKFDKTASGALFFNSLIESSKEEVKVFPPYFFYPSTPQERRDAYAIHHAARSWKTQDEWRETALKAEQRLDGVRHELEAQQTEYEKTRAALEELERQVELGEGTRKLRILFFLRSIHYDRVLENFLRELLERGHEMHVALVLEKRGLGEDKTRLFEEFRSRYRFSYERMEPRRDQWTALAVAYRHGLDYLRYLEPEFSHAEPLRERARERAPVLVRGTMRIVPFNLAKRPLRGLLRASEAPLPLPKQPKQLIKDYRPDVVMVSPLIGLGSLETDHVRAAHEAGVPTALIVASWDNLTNKGVMRDVPTMTIVWNETQVEEAVRLHRVPRSNVAAVGAHSFDHWFDWEPSSTREEFAKRMNLDPARPLLLYLGSSNFISGDETPFVREWLEQVRSHPKLKEAAVILRPHPQNSAGWEDLGLDEPGKTIVWPKKGYAPTDDEKKREYFDTLYHSNAVIGLNTTALIEASILDRPVLTLITDQFDTQEGTLHFSYISAEGSGPVVVARDWKEHLNQIADAVESPSGTERREAFVKQFVRPRGLDVPAAPAAVDVVESTARRSAPRRHAALFRPLWYVLWPLRPLILFALQPRETWRRWVKWVQNLIKRVKQRRKDMRKAVKEQARAKTKSKPVVSGSAPAKPSKARPSPATDLLAEVAHADGEQATNGTKEVVKPRRSRPKGSQLSILMGELDKVEPGGKRARERAREKDRLRRQQEAAAGEAPPPEGVSADDPVARVEERLDQMTEVLMGMQKQLSSLSSAPGTKTSRLRAPSLRERSVRAKRGRKPNRHGLRERSSKRARKAVKFAKRRWKYSKRALRATVNKRNRFTYKRTAAHVPSRDEIPVLLNARGLLGVGAEIGVKTGKYSDLLLRNWKGQRLISIDPWLSADPDEYVDRSNVSQDEFDENYLATRDRLAPYGDRSEIWRLMSVEAAERVADRSMDFVYIDARHDYESVLEDLEAWYPKMKPGGILAGHDYADGMFEQGDFGVKSAVDEFFAAKGISVRSTDGPSAVEMFPTWIVEIPVEIEGSPAPEPEREKDLVR